MEHFNARAQSTLKQVPQERFKVGELLGHPRLGEGDAAGDHQGAKEWYGAPTFIAIGPLHDFSGGGRFGGRDPLTRLN